MNKIDSYHYTLNWDIIEKCHFTVTLGLLRNKMAHERTFKWTKRSETLLPQAFLEQNQSSLKPNNYALGPEIQYLPNPSKNFRLTLCHCSSKQMLTNIGSLGGFSLHQQSASWLDWDLDILYYTSYFRLKCKKSYIWISSGEQDS